MDFERVLVTGGSGQLGRFVMKELLDHCGVSVLDLVPPQADVPFFEADILDRQAVAAAVAGCDAVVHLAALDAAIDATDEEFLRTNIGGVRNVLDAAGDAGVRRIVLCSSVAAYNISPENPPRYLPVDVDHPAAPVTAYGRSKLAGEALAREVAPQFRDGICCLRPTLVMQSDIAYDLALKTVASHGAEPPPPASDPSWVTLSEEIPGSRSFVGPADAARCFRAALEAKGRGVEAYNVAAADTYSPLPTLEVVRREFGAQPEIRDAARYEADPRASIYDISSTREVLGWKPRERWADLLERVIAGAAG